MTPEHIRMMREAADHFRKWAEEEEHGFIVDTDAAETLLRFSMELAHAADVANLLRVSLEKAKLTHKPKLPPAVAAGLGT